MITYYDMYGMPVSMERWSQLLTQPKHIAEDRITIRGRRFHVSTVWLGLDHGFIAGAPPIIFETMIFPDDGSFHDIYCRRYSTRELALAGHKAAKRWLRREMGQSPKSQPLIHKGGKPKLARA